MSCSGELLASTRPHWNITPFREKTSQEKLCKTLANQIVDTFEIIHSFLFIRHLNAALEVFCFLARSVDFVASLLMRAAAQCFLSANVNQLLDLTVYSHFNLLAIYETRARLIDGKHVKRYVYSL